MRKGPQSYLPRVKLMDLDEWLVVDPENRQETVLNALKEAIAQITAKSPHKAQWLEEGLAGLLNTKLVDIGKPPNVQEVNAKIRPKKEKSIIPSV